MAELNSVLPIDFKPLGFKKNPQNADKLSMRNVLIVFAVLLFFQVLAAIGANGITPGLTTCGRYQIKGYIRKDPVQTLKFMVNEGTQSQNQFKINSGELGKFAGYIDIYITGEMNVIHIDGTSGVVSEPSEIKPAVPNPLGAASEPGLILLKKRACQW